MELSNLEKKSIKQLENLTGIKASLERERKKENPNPTKIANLENTLRLTEAAFVRTQAMV